MGRKLGVREGCLADCPISPNCVCSDASDPGHRIPPLALAVGPEQAWRAIEELVASRPRTRIVERATDYLRGDVAIKGGLTSCLKTAHMAEAFQRLGFDPAHGEGALHEIISYAQGMAGL